VGNPAEETYCYPNTITYNDPPPFVNRLFNPSPPLICGPGKPPHERHCHRFGLARNARERSARSAPAAKVAQTCNICNLPT